jgi:antitoxin (DNA-binding transcriptional repressor) of toxin-antitoxin stability system
MKVVDVQEARIRLACLIQEALDGEDIVIACGNEPVVRLVRVESARPKRSVGWAKGQVTMASDFDAPLDGF